MEQVSTSALTRNYEHEIRSRADRIKRNPVAIGDRVLDKVRAILMRGEPRTIRQLATELDRDSGTVGARVRDHRKQAFGGWRIVRDWSPALKAYTYRIGA